MSEHRDIRRPHGGAANEDFTLGNRAARNESGNLDLGDL
jgi:hypothetical protein